MTMNYRRLALFTSLTLTHIGLALAILLLLCDGYRRSGNLSFLALALMAISYSGVQIVALRIARQEQFKWANWIFNGALLLSALLLPVFVHNGQWHVLLLLLTIPGGVIVSGRFQQLPTFLVLSFVAMATALLLDLLLPSLTWRIVAQGSYLWSVTGALSGLYLLSFVVLVWHHYRSGGASLRPKINVATQYTLFFTGISVVVTLLVTSVMITQIRNTQIKQVGKSFETIAENYAKLVGAHLEQQTQKLQLLTRQVTLFKAALDDSNKRYFSRAQSNVSLKAKNRLWQQSEAGSPFVMHYLNNPTNVALSRFRGHNSFHHDLLLVDAYGGLVAGLGPKPERFYFFDQPWWQLSWNGGLGNIYIGDLETDERTGVPKIRIAVDIVDHSSNKVIGMLSSYYLLRTLVEDLQRFRPESVEQISLTDKSGRVIASTVPKLVGECVWAQLCEQGSRGDNPSGWELGLDHRGEAALIGYSSLSTVYNVISDPLHRLGWQVVVSGTRSNALIEVTRSTKLAMAVGLLAMALGVLGAIAAARVITRPIEHLTATTTAMSQGDLNCRAELTGPTELVELSAGFNRLAERLHNVIRNLRAQTRKLVRAKKEAEAATRLKGQFLANMSHEIRTPLNAVLGFADILESTIEDEHQKRHAQIIKNSGNDLLHLINDILDLSKIEAGRMEMQLAPVDLRALFGDLQRVFSVAAAEKSISLQVKAADDLPHYVLLDRARLRQVLFNLIGNAVKFTERGWVRCVVTATERHRHNRLDLQIVVEDTGVGIDAEAYEEIFESFKQHQHEHSSDVQEGTGLGLTISKNLVEMMGGTIAVEGEKGQGAKFMITLPGVDTAIGHDSSVQKSNAPEQRKSVSFAAADLLIADDLEVNRQHISEALEAFPFSIWHAADGRAAVTKAFEQRFDLILMDIRMPILDGYRALETIRQHFGDNAPVIIATTASGMKEDLIKIDQAGFDDYLIRPFDREALLDVLQRYLDADEVIEGQPLAERSVLTASAIAAAPLWQCHDSDLDGVLNALEQQWYQVSKKQSIPDIMNFAGQVEAAGERFSVELLQRYGHELAESSEGYDIYNVEKLLPLYAAVLQRRVDSL